jgi:hypothetical protein
MASVPRPAFIARDAEAAAEPTPRPIGVEVPDDRISLRANFPMGEIQHLGRLGRYFEVFRLGPGVRPERPSNLDVARAELEASEIKTTAPEAISQGRGRCCLAR